MPESKFTYKPEPVSAFPCRYCGRPASFAHRYGDGALCQQCQADIAEERDLEVYPDGWQHRAAYDAVRKSRRMATLATERFNRLYDALHWPGRWTSSPALDMMQTLMVAACLRNMAVYEKYCADAAAHGYGQ